MLNIPDNYHRFPNQQVELSKFVKERAIVNTCEDYGPLTKILPAILKYGMDEEIVTIDDDCILHPETMETFYVFSDFIPNSALALRGRKLRFHIQ